MPNVIDQKRDAIALVCRQFGIQRLFVLGSALREDFRPGESVVDLLIEFKPLGSCNKVQAYYDVLKTLKDLFQSDVNLVMASANRIIDIEIERTKQLVYAAPIIRIPSRLELASYVAHRRLARWTEKFSALINDGDSLCLLLDSWSSDGIPVEVMLGATKKQKSFALYWGQQVDGWGYGWGQIAKKDINIDILCCCQCGQHASCPFGGDDDADPLTEAAFLGEYNMQELSNALWWWE